MEERMAPQMRQYTELFMPCVSLPNKSYYEARNQVNGQNWTFFTQTALVIPKFPGSSLIGVNPNDFRGASCSVHSELVLVFIDRMSLCSNDLLPENSNTLN